MVGGRGTRPIFLRFLDRAFRTSSSLAAISVAVLVDYSVENRSVFAEVHDSGASARVEDLTGISAADGPAVVLGFGQLATTSVYVIQSRSLAVGPVKDRTRTNFVVFNSSDL